ncbi:hypothetical protein Y032_0153g2915 [Ancylostoma ceylanicum]|uniref:Uncharacterized protein n=1 Tax=Ancylostoma ceylanicum TaxID=53326 RepID=A0A016T077_9BILA|nr:hypothetical protein Y032_0153g2915 [Ancylostoma ceylanicum]
MLESDSGQSAEIEKYLVMVGWCYPGASSISWAWQLERGRRGEACLQCSCSALDRLLSSTTRRSAYKTLPDSTHHPILLRILTI